MGSGERRIESLGDIEFNDRVSRSVSEYAKQTQRLARDMASELDVGATAAHSAMLKLRFHPRLQHLNVRWRARRVARHLARARDLAQGISAEAVRFNLQYRREFLDIDSRGDTSKAKYTGEVDL
ncbi:hypothetical protein [Actinomadura rudentiformis]|uniref:Uncharacterized protein n=1 Tax=Actinomadura rudentiformis TaxID=359158 RepID=A0A6H9YE38_9ACTN|nr:hypothetical protein [Actinomadura rudentiformis]KAB2341871.1 hypothetical protein F8566_40550 [Actinomadura rudentiformis]